MDIQFDIKKLLEAGKIENELDFERALIADRKLRILAKDSSELKNKRKKLRDLIEKYEKQYWNTGSEISDEKIKESDIVEIIAEKERLFIQRRKQLIRQKLKQFNLTQQDFGKILGHSSKSYMSELINGISPFALKDLVIINKLLKIDLIDLVPTFLPQLERSKIKIAIDKLGNPKLKLNEDDLATA